MELKDYTIDDLHSSVNDIYTQFDEGYIDFKETQEMLKNCCEAFVHFNKE